MKKLTKAVLILGAASLVVGYQALKPEIAPQAPQVIIRYVTPAPTVAPKAQQAQPQSANICTSPSCYGYVPTQPTYEPVKPYTYTAPTYAPQPTYRPYTAPVPVWQASTPQPCHTWGC